MSKTDKETLADKMARLDEYVEWFTGEDFVLEQSLAKFNEAEKLAESIEHDLATFKNEITVLKKKFDQA